ncbi:hypothetical protein [uncultured Pelagimonas sp.]|uniref:hypothetical protein n=1 Tax=uncultured Pelagimonas sp. TaxID=1618102 RepID=UPI00261796BF|nr:hypothetical protein [uncultured Pelagimonas sp.]
MTTTAARLSGFDIATVPSGISLGDEGPFANISLVFRPNGMSLLVPITKAAVSNEIKDAITGFFPGADSVVHESVYRLILTDPEALDRGEDAGLPTTIDDLTPDQINTLKAVSAEEKQRVLWERPTSLDARPIAEILIDSFAVWLADLPQHLHSVSQTTFLRMDDAKNQSEPQPQDIQLCSISIPNPFDSSKFEVYRVPCSWSGKEDANTLSEIDLSAFETPSDLNEFVQQNGSLNPLNYEGILSSKEVTEVWSPEEAQKIWQGLFSSNELRNLARALLFPNNPSGLRNPEQIRVRKANKITLRSDHVSVIAAGLSEIKSTELLAAWDATISLRSKNQQKGTDRFNEGLTPGDLIGTIHGRLLGAVRSYAPPQNEEAQLLLRDDGADTASKTPPELVAPPSQAIRLAELYRADSLKPRVDFPELTATRLAQPEAPSERQRFNDEDLLLLAEKRREAALRSLVLEEDDVFSSLGYNVSRHSPSLAQKKGNIRPGFGQVVMEQERSTAKYFAASSENARSVWKKAFEGEESDQDTNAIVDENQFLIADNIAVAVADVLGEKGTLALDDNPNTLNPEQGSLNDAVPFARALAASKSAWRRGVGRVAVKNPTDEAADEALKRFQEIYAHPVLAEKLGLIRDYKVPLEELLNETGGAEFFRLSATTSFLSPHTQTATILQAELQGSLAFRPSGRAEWFDSTPDPKAGLKDLTEKRFGTPRFALQTLDEQQVLNSFEGAADGTTDQFLAGEVEENLDAHLPQVRRYGIALIDRGRLDEEIENLAASEISEEWHGNSPMLTFAENLTIGFRLDVGIAQPEERTAWFAAGDRDIDYYRLRNSPDLTDLKVSTKTARPEVRHRSTSYVTGINRYLDHPDAIKEVKNVDGSLETVPAAVGGYSDVVVQETLATWQGRSLSLPRRAREDEFIVQDWFSPMVDPDEGPLPIEMDYSEPEISEEEDDDEIGLDGVVPGLPPQRERAGYYFGARPVFLNRGGPRLSDALNYYNGNIGPHSLRLGAVDGDKPLIFGRNEPIGAPEILLPTTQSGTAREPLFVAHAPSESAYGLKHGAESTFITQWPGNSVDDLILRSKGEEESTAGSSISTDNIDTVQRYILPPRIDIAAAEVAGVLDVQSSDVLAGLFDKDNKVHRVRWSGGFPVAVGGEELDEPDVPEILDDPLSTVGSSDESTKQKAARGGVLVGRSGDNSVDFPYLPDPLANVLCLMPTREGRPLLDEPIRLEALKGGTGWPNQAPCVLQLMRPETEPPDDTTFEESEIEADGLTLRIGTSSRNFLEGTLPTLGIWLNDGRSCELATWFAPVFGEDVASHRLLQMAFSSQSYESSSRFNNLRGQAGTFAALATNHGTYRQLGELLSRTPVRGLVTVRRLSLVNATKRPIRAPEYLVPEGISHVPFARVNLAERVAEQMLVEPAPSAKQATIKALEAWLGDDTIIEKMKDGSAENEAAESTNMVFGGQVLCDRPSTDQLRIEARWKEYLDDPSQPARRDECDPLRRFSPVDPDEWTHLEGTLATVENTAELAGKPVNLLRDPGGSLRCIMHDFYDTKARKIQLRVSAISRHSKNFATNDRTSQTFITPGQPTEEFVLRATARPAAPVLAEQMLPVFQFDRINLISHGVGGPPRQTGIKIERHSKLRYFIQRPWFDAGFDQRLAVLLWDGALFDSTGESKADRPETIPEDIPEEMRTRVSLQGRDPKFDSVSVNDFLTGDDFLNDLTEERMAHLELPGVSPPNELSDGHVISDYQVSAALFPVELDRQRDVWISDIHMRGGTSYMPYVRLSLAACQHRDRTLKGLELSQPVDGWARVPPRRVAEVTINWTEGRPDASARVVVNGGTYRQRQPGTVLSDLKPTVDKPWLELIFLERSAGVSGEGGWTKVDTSHPTPIQSGAAGSSVSDNLWDLRVELPSDWRLDGNLSSRAILIREYERTAADGDGPSPQALEGEETALKIVEAFATSPDGLSSVIRGKTTFACLITQEELLTR